MSDPTIVDHPLSIEVGLRFHLGSQIAIGPGKAQLLDAIRRTGSISAAGREMGISYKHAWLPGASLTSLGLEVLECYRRMQSLAAEAIRPEVGNFKRRIHER